MIILLSIAMYVFLGIAVVLLLLLVMIFGRDKTEHVAAASIVLKQQSARSGQLILRIKQDIQPRRGMEVFIYGDGSYSCGTHHKVLPVELFQMALDIAKTELIATYDCVGPSMPECSNDNRNGYSASKKDGERIRISNINYDKISAILDYVARDS